MEKFYFKPVTFKGIENVVRNITTNKVAGGEIPKIFWNNQVLLKKCEKIHNAYINAYIKNAYIILI